MKKIYSKIRVGTKVKVVGIEEFRKVKSINEGRTLFTLEGVSGSFQRGHIIEAKFSRGHSIENPDYIDAYC